MFLYLTIMILVPNKISFKVSVNSTNSTILSLTFSTTNVPVESIWVDHVYILYAYCVPELLFHGGQITLGSILHVLFHCGILFKQSAVLNSFHLSNHNILIMNEDRFFLIFCDTLFWHIKDIDLLLWININCRKTQMSLYIKVKFSKANHFTV